MLILDKGIVKSDTNTKYNKTIICNKNLNLALSKILISENNPIKKIKVKDTKKFN